MSDKIKPFLLKKAYIHTNFISPLTHTHISSYKHTHRPLTQCKTHVYANTRISTHKCPILKTHFSTCTLHNTTQTRKHMHIADMCLTCVSYAYSRHVSDMCMQTYAYSRHMQMQTRAYSRHVSDMCMQTCAYNRYMHTCMQTHVYAKISMYIYPITCMHTLYLCVALGYDKL